MIAPDLRLLSQEQVGNWLGVSKHTLAKWRDEMRGPAWIRVGRFPRYRQEDVQAYLDENSNKPYKQE